MPNVYLISNKTAGELADFVRQGGGVIFIDGPTRAIGQADIQAITGMKARGGYFSEWTLLTAMGEHPLIPNSQRDADLSTYQRQAAQWREFRAQGVSAVIQEVYQRIKAQHPEVIVSATITSDQKRAAQVTLQDWRTWLKNGTIDVLIPMAYVNDVESLPAVLETWRPAVQEYGRVVFGVIDFVENGKSDESRK